MNLFPRRLRRLFSRTPVLPATTTEPMVALRPRAAATAYEGASQGRRSVGWRPPSLGANDATLSSAAALRDRARNAVRNDGYAYAAIDKLVANIVGTGIVPQSQAPDPAFREQVERLWGRWTSEADADGILDFYGVQALAVRNWLEAGEVFTRLRYRVLSDGLTVPLQLQLLESEFCPTDYNLDAQSNRIRAGIEFDAIGRRSAYWMYARRPGSLFDLQRVDLHRVPAATVLHMYEPQRPGQIRGLPHLTQALVRLYELDKYDDATLLRQQLSNMFVGFIKAGSSAVGAGLDPITGAPIIRDDEGRARIGLEPGMFHELEPGQEVAFSEPPEASGYAEFMSAQLRAAAIAAGVPYEVLTGDTRDMNDRTVRLIINEFRRRVEQRQYHVVGHQFCRPIWNAWFRQALISGALAIPAALMSGSAGEETFAKYAAVEWVPPRWDYIHPVQDVEAERALVRSGFKSRTQVAKERGYDAETLDSEIAADNTRADRLGLVFDSDARRTGPSQTVAVPEDTPNAQRTVRVEPAAASGQALIDVGRAPAVHASRNLTIVKRLIRDAQTGRLTGVIEEHVPPQEEPKPSGEGRATERSRRGQGHLKRITYDERGPIARIDEE